MQGTPRGGRPDLRARPCRKHKDPGQGPPAPAFLPARHIAVFLQDFKWPINFLNTFGDKVF